MRRKSQKESGNALVYVLIAIALFAALSMTIGRQTDSSEATAIDDGQAELLATQLISYAGQAKSAVDQMGFLTRGTIIGNLLFTLPTAGTFNTAPHTYKVYHPDGGGLNPGNIPDDAKASGASDPVPGWYMGRFNTIGWTATAGQDVILVAFNIKQGICEKINEAITGSTTIPATGDDAREYFVDDNLHVGGNQDLATMDCAGCNDNFSLCVQGSAGYYAFYNIIADQ